MAEVGSAFVSVVPSARGFGKKLDSDIGPQLDNSGKSGGKRLGSSLSSGLKSALTPALALLSAAGAVSFLKGSIGEAREAQKVGALTNAVIKSTGGVAKVSAKDVDTLSTALSKKTGVDDEAIAAGQNMLLTFSKVRNEVGKGNDIFNQATVAANDMAAAFGGDAVSNSKLLGKALNDPVKGVSALTKVGVSFSQGQKDQIKDLVAHNDLLGAQRIILGEVTKQTKGAAEATATSGEKAKVAYDNLKETIGTALLPVLDRFQVKVTKDVIPAVSKFVTGMQDGTGAGGDVADTLGDIYSAAKPIAATIGKVVAAFGDLPGGTQKVLLLAGAALLLKNRFSESLPSMQSFSREGAIAAAKTVAIRGGALAAGAGLATLASKSGGATTDLGALATVGAGIATGFAVGGPWGAAIGGGAGLLKVFTSRSKAAADEQTRLDTAAKLVADTLDRQSGALTKNTRATVAKQFADNGVYNAGRVLGLSIKTVTDAALGNTAAIDLVTAATTDATTGHQNMSGQAIKLRDAIGTTNTAIDKERTKIGQVGEAMDAVDGKKANVTVTTSGVTGAVSGLRTLDDLLRGIGSKTKVNVSVPGMFPGNAKGTDNWRGGLTMVGEKGPELINLAKGAQVIPNNKISAGVTGASRSTTPTPPATPTPVVLDSVVVGYLRQLVDGRIGIAAVDSKIQARYAV